LPGDCSIQQSIELLQARDRCSPGLGRLSQSRRSSQKPSELGGSPNFRHGKFAPEALNPPEWIIWDKHQAHSISSRGLT
jgi:hypothetical protein